MQIRTVSIYLCKCLFLLLIILVLTIYTVLFTNTGLKFTAKTIAYFIPGTLSIGKLDGRLISGVSFANFVYQSSDIKVVIASGKVSWDSQYLWERLVINNISADAIKVYLPINAQNVKVKQTKQNRFTLPAWLSNLTIKNTRLRNIQLYKSDHHLYIDEFAQVESNLGHHQIHVKALKGEISALVKLNWENSGWAIKAELKHIDPAMINKAWPGNLNLTLNSSGVWNGEADKFEFLLVNADGNLRGYPLQGHGAVQYENNKLSIQNIKLKLDEAYAEVNGNYDKDWHIEWKLNIPSLGAIIPDGKGVIKSEGHVSGALNQPQIQANINASQLAWQDLYFEKIIGRVSSLLKKQTAEINLFVGGFKLQGFTLPQVKFASASHIESTKLISTMRVDFGDNNQAHGSFSLPEFFSNRGLSQSINGKMHFKFPEIENIFVIPYAKKIQGQIQGSVNIDGKLENLKVNAHAELLGGQTEIPTLGLKLQNIKGNAEFISQRPLMFNVDFNSGIGSGVLTGKINLTDNTFPFFLKLNGNDLIVSNTAEYKIKASPNLIFNYADNLKKLKGNIKINSAIVRTRVNNNITHLPSEVVFADRKKTSTQTTVPVNTMMDVSINLGNNIDISYENLKTKIKGDLNIKQDRGGLLLATGELQVIKGKYKAYGRLLNITSGRLIYIGNVLNNPGLDIRAEQKFRSVSLETGESQFNETSKLGSVYTGTTDLIVGILVKGTLNKPYVTLFSEPPGLKQSDILSYLVFGYPQENIKNAGSLALLNQLASTVSSRNGPTNSVGKITQNIKRTFGLSELGLGSTEYFDTSNNNVNTTTTFNIGKKIGKKLSIHYSVGVFDPVSILNLKYQINKRLAIQTETSTTDNGVDLFYEFERD